MIKWVHTLHRIKSFPWERKHLRTFKFDRVVNPYEVKGQWNEPDRSLVRMRWELFDCVRALTINSDMVHTCGAYRVTRRCTSAYNKDQTKRIPNTGLPLSRVIDTHIELRFC